MRAYYNENDLFAAAWLRELISAGHIAPGEVDERSIEDVKPVDLVGFSQCHFFAGIGGWSYALRLAGWADDRPCWTASCPCQPFSAAGKGAGFTDERHLWPALYWLVEQCRPAIIFGEQVASKATEPWFDLIQADLEAVGYAFGCVPFPVAGIGAPHLRDRAYWVADSNHDRRDKGRERVTEAGNDGFIGNCAIERLADSDNPIIPDRGESKVLEQRPGSCSVFHDNRPTSQTNGQWGDVDWLFCRDGKWRPVEPGTFPLAHGVSGRVGRLRGYGNAIVPQQAAEFIKAVIQGR